MNMQVGNHLRLSLIKMQSTLEETKELKKEYFSNLGCVSVYVCLPVFEREHS